MTKYYWNKDYHLKKSQGTKLMDYNLDPPDDELDEIEKIEQEYFEPPDELLSQHANLFHF